MPQQQRREHAADQATEAVWSTYPFSLPHSFPFLLFACLSAGRQIMSYISWTSRLVLCMHSMRPDFPLSSPCVQALGMFLANPVLSLVDTGFVGKYNNKTSLAALGPSTAVCDQLMYLASFISVATVCFYSLFLFGNLV